MSRHYYSSSSDDGCLFGIVFVLLIVVIGFCVLLVVDSISDPINSCPAIPNATIFPQSNDDEPSTKAVIFISRGDTGEVWGARCKSGEWEYGRPDLSEFPLEIQNRAMTLIPCSEPLISTNFNGSKYTEVESIGWVCPQQSNN